MDDLKYNGSGYRDVTAERAIRKQINSRRK